MENLYFEDIKTEFYNGSAWVDISSDVVTSIVGSDGFASGDPTDRVATLGAVSFSLNNSSKKYSPMGGDSVRGLTTLAGWGRGTRVRISVSYSTVVGLVVFSGRVDKIDTDSGNYGNNRVHVSCVTYIDILANASMRNTLIDTDLRFDQALTSVLGRIPSDTQPDSTDFDEGTEIFTSVFDGVKYKTKAISEVNRLALSELGYVYLRKDGTLVAENKLHRKGTDPASEVALLDPGYLMNQSGYYIRKEDGDRILLSLVGNPDIATSMQDLEIKLEDRVINSMSVKVYPRKVDTTAKVLYSITSPIKIPTGGTVTIKGYYTDPDGGGGQISGFDMITPVANTDYHMDLNPAGGGTNITGSLSITATYYSDSVEYTLTNNYNSTYPGYVTFLQARGYGLYTYNPVEVSFSDDGSMDDFGESSTVATQAYKDEPSAGYQFIKSVVEENKNSKSRLKRASFIANTSEDNMMSFMYHDIGSKVELTEVRSNITNHYYIVSRKYSIDIGGVVKFSYILQEANSLLSGGLTSLNTKFGEPGYELDFGAISYLSRMNQMSISLWTKRFDMGGSLVRNLASNGAAGYKLSVDGTANRISFTQVQDTTAGTWVTPASGITYSGLYHIVLTRDTSSSATTDPHIYINGVDQTLTETSTPVGTVTDDTLQSFIVSQSGSWCEMQDVRVYSGILSSSDVTDLYNGGVPDVYVLTDNMVFQGLCKYTDSLEDGDTTYVNFGSTNNSRAVDNMYKTVGEVTYDTFDLGKWRLKTDTVADSIGLNCIAWSPSLGLFAAGRAGGGSSNKIITSPDGITWTARATVTANAIDDIVWSPELGIFVAVTYGRSYSSSDGITWTSHSYPTGLTTTNYDKVEWSPELGIFVATSQTNYGAMTSTDGITWTNIGTISTENILSLKWAPGLSMFVGGETGKIIKSTDGVSWTESTLVTGNFWGSTWSPELGMLVLVGNLDIRTTTDGVNWFSRTLPASNTWKSVEWSPYYGKFVAISSTGTGNRSMQSSDGITWTTLTTPQDSSWTNLVWSPEKKIFVAVSSTATHNVMIR